MIIRPLRAGDGPGLADCIHEVYVEYQCTWDPDGYHADLYQIDDYLDPDIARFWVAEQEGRIVGTGGVAWHPRVPGAEGSVLELEGDLRVCGTDCELIRYYVRPRARRQGIAQRIVELSLEAASERGNHAVEIWSDKRFEGAHVLYRNFGAIQVGERICPGDPDCSEEWGFWLNLKLPSG